MSYYILTPTSNLVNILSSESISPAAVYEKRNYGFKRFDLCSDDDPREFIRIFVDLPDLTKYDAGNGAVSKKNDGDSCQNMEKEGTDISSCPEKDEEDLFGNPAKKTKDDGASTSAMTLKPDERNGGNSCPSMEKEGSGVSSLPEQDEKDLSRNSAKKTEDEGNSITLMALELDESLVRRVSGNSDDGLWTSETIRISPAKCAFIFRTQKDLSTSFNSVQRSIEAKFAQRYRDKAKVAAGKVPAKKRLESDDPSRHKEPGQEQDKTRPPHDEDIARYERVDRIKGAIFGYYLGFDCSLPEDPLVRNDAFEYLENLHSMVNSVTVAKEGEIDKKKNSLESILWRFAIDEKFEESCHVSEMTLDEKKSFREAFSLEEAISRLKSASSVPHPNNMRNDTSGLNMYRTDLEKRIHEAIDKYKSQTSLADADKLKVKNEKGPRLQIPDKHGDLVSDIINRLIREGIPESDKKSLRYPFAHECGKAVRRCIGDRWEGSGEQGYVNRLLKHLDNSEDFDPNDKCGIADVRSFETLKFIALLSEKKGNNELDNFHQYMLTQCKVADFCIPFAFWGAVFGFSAMPKTLCNSMSEAAENAARTLFDEVLDCIDEWDEAKGF